MKINNITILIVSVILLILIAPFLLTRTSFTGIDFSTTGQIGDTIGGITAPFINIGAAVLVYLSFKEQIKANKLLSKETNYTYIKALYDSVISEIDSYKKLKFTSHPLVEFINKFIIILSKPSINIEEHNLFLSEQILIRKTLIGSIIDLCNEIYESHLPVSMKKNFISKIKISCSILEISKDLKELYNDILEEKGMIYDKNCKISIENKTKIRILISDAFYLNNQLKVFDS